MNGIIKQIFGEKRWPDREESALIIAVCVDDRWGMRFHQRRQSQDRVLREDLLRTCGDRLLWMAPASAPLFSDHAGQIRADSAYLQRAGTGELCFVEDPQMKGCEERIEQVLLYRWNRTYPADVYFTFDLTTHGFTKTRSEEFRGSSHEKITKEFYERSTG